jgi:hypothetical protein
VYGAVIEVRETWLQRDGVMVEFGTPEESRSGAAQCAVRNTSASLSYEARERSAIRPS